MLMIIWKLYLYEVDILEIIIGGKYEMHDKRIFIVLMPELKLILT